MATKRARDGERKGPAASDAATPAPRHECRVLAGRGRALVATDFIRKGESFLSEVPVAAVQAVGNRARFLACAHCLAPAGPLEHHLALAAGSACTTRKELVASATNTAAPGPRRAHELYLGSHVKHLPRVPRLVGRESRGRCDADNAVLASASWRTICGVASPRLLR